MRQLHLGFPSLSVAYGRDHYRVLGVVAANRREQVLDRRGLRAPLRDRYRGRFRPPGQVSPPISERNLELARSCHGVFGGDNDPIGAIHGGDIYSPRRAP